MAITYILCLDYHEMAAFYETLESGDPLIDRRSFPVNAVDEDGDPYLDQSNNACAFMAFIPQDAQLYSGMVFFDDYESLKSAAAPFGVTLPESSKFPSISGVEVS